MHYHLKTGGVTTVIRQQIEALKPACDLLLLTGEPTDLVLPCETVHIPGLGYDESAPKPVSAELVSSLVEEAIIQKWPKGCDVLHVHNPLLAKNSCFLDVLTQLKTKQYNLLLQVHDFAEDGRPNVYYQEAYPSNCHYGVLNSRDYRILIRSGLKPEGLHMIPNTVNPLPAPEPTKTDLTHVLYPIRAIRRKNIGEAILLSLYFEQGQRLCITQPPNTPSDRLSYSAWKAFVKARGLNISMEAGTRKPFLELVKQSKYMLTTSIGEGFGFSFLEPWTAGKFLWGRKLPDLCSDFEEKGLHLDHLYRHIRVPVEWFDLAQFELRWRAAVADCSRRFGIPITQQDTNTAFKRMTTNGSIDFGLLDESSQMQVLSQLLTEPPQKEKLARVNPFIKGPGNLRQLAPMIRKNRNTIKRVFTIDSYRGLLLDAYRKVIRIPVRHRISKSVVANEFFNLGFFSLLKWSNDADFG